MIEGGRRERETTTKEREETEKESEREIGIETKEEVIELVSSYSHTKAQTRIGTSVELFCLEDLGLCQKYKIK